jgi:hypothetical protein
MAKSGRVRACAGGERTVGQRSLRGMALAGACWLGGSLAGLTGCASSSPGPAQGEPARPGAAAAAVTPAPAAVVRQPHDPGQYVVFEPGPGRFELVSGTAAAPLVLAADEPPSVQRAARDLAADVGRVSAITPVVSIGAAQPAQQRTPRSAGSGG